MSLFIFRINKRRFQIETSQHPLLNLIFLTVFVTSFFYFFLFFVKMLESIFFFFGILALIHVINYVFRFIFCYIGKPFDVKKLNTKWVLITGANNGIGRLFALRFADMGMNIIGTGRNLERLEKVQKEVESKGVEFVSVPVDFQEDGSVDKLINSLGDRDIGLYILNAGFGIFGDFLDYSDERLITFCNAMVINQALLTKKFIERNKDRKDKTIIFDIASLAANAIWADGQMYCAVKAFQSTYIKHIALEAETYSNITVQAIHPSFFGDSGFFDKLPPFLKKFYASSPLLQTSEGVVETSLRVMGKNNMADTSASGAFFKLLYWFMGEQLSRIVNLLIIKFSPKVKPE